MYNESLKCHMWDFVACALLLEYITQHGTNLSELLCMVECTMALRQKLPVLSCFLLLLVITMINLLLVLYIHGYKVLFLAALDQPPNSKTVLWHVINSNEFKPSTENVVDVIAPADHLNTVDVQQMADDAAPPPMDAVGVGQMGDNTAPPLGAVDIVQMGDDASRKENRLQVNTENVVDVIVPADHLNTVDVWQMADDAAPPSMDAVDRDVGQMGDNTAPPLDAVDMVQMGDDASRKENRLQVNTENVVDVIVPADHLNTVDVWQMADDAAPPSMDAVDRDVGQMGDNTAPPLDAVDMVQMGDDASRKENRLQVNTENVVDVIVPADHLNTVDVWQMADDAAPPSMDAVDRDVGQMGDNTAPPLDAVDMVQMGDDASRKENRLQVSSLEQKQYLLAMVYAEQLTASTKHYISLVGLAAHWGMWAVEPLITKSRLHGARCLYGSVENQTFHHYARLTNMVPFDRELSQCFTSDRASLIDNRTVFLSRSYRDIVVVHFVLLKPHPIASNCGNILGNGPYRKELKQSGNNMVECTKIAANRGLSGAVERTLNEELNTNGLSDIGMFHVSRVVCVNGLQEVSLAGLKDFAQSPGGRESVVFVMWQSGRTVASLSTDIRLHRCSVSIQHSTEVSKAASLFLYSLNLKKPFLSIHIRTERIIHTNSLHPGYQKCCMKRLHMLIYNIMEKHKLLNVLLMRDYGQYGTDSCFYGNRTLPRRNKPHWFCKRLSDDIMEEIGEWGIHYSAFDPSKFQMIENAGFVSFVEADALLQGEVLLTVGFGGFQGQLHRKFASLGTDTQFKAYHICPCYTSKENLHGLLTSESCDV